MGMMKEFKEFAMRGNVVDMAVGIIIGAAFGTIVKSLVSDIIMPPIGMALAGRRGPGGGSGIQKEMILLNNLHSISCGSWRSSACMHQTTLQGTHQRI